MSRKKLGPLVIGYDLSLRSPALVALAGEPDAEWRWVVDRSTLKPSECVTDAERYERYMHIAEWAVSYAQRLRPARAFVEGYAFSRNNASASRLMELGGVVRVEMMRAGHVLKPLVISTARKVLLGKLPKKDAKLAVQTALYEHGAPFQGDDECDAFAVANAGRAEMGHTALSLA